MDHETGSGPGYAGASQLLDDNNIVQPVATAAAIGLFDVGAQQALFASFAPQLPWHDPRPLPVPMVRYHLGIDETAHRGAEDFMLFGKESTRDHGCGCVNASPVWRQQPRPGRGRPRGCASVRD